MIFYRQTFIMKSSKLLLIISILYSAIIHAQVNVTNTGTLKLSIGSDTLYINGAFTNNSGSAFTNNGQFYVKQDLTNDQSSMTVGTGTLYLNGSGAQTISR